MSHLSFISSTLLGLFLAGSLLAMTQQEAQKPAGRLRLKVRRPRSASFWTIPAP